MKHPILICTVLFLLLTAGCSKETETVVLTSDAPTQSVTTDKPDIIPAHGATPPPSETDVSLPSCTTENTLPDEPDVPDTEPISYTESFTPPVAEETVFETTAPPETEHQHSYIANTISPSCDSIGYTEYLCACGNSYTSNETPATGHTFGDWTVTTEATTENYGQRERICSLCGVKEIGVIDMIAAEIIDLEALATYGRTYAVNTYGYEVDTSMNRNTYCGYYPGGTSRIITMDEGYSEVAGWIDATTQQLIAAHDAVVKEIDGVKVGMRINVEVESNGDNIYTVWVYYG